MIIEKASVLHKEISSYTARFAHLDIVKTLESILQAWEYYDKESGEAKKKNGG